MRRLLAVVALLVVSAPEPTAEACNNAITASDEAVKKVAAAEAKLDEGANAEAAEQVRALRKITPLEFTVVPEPKTKDDRLTNRAVRVYALACVRLGGSIGPWGDKTERERKLNVEHVVNLLAALASPKDAAPSVRSDYGEGLARTKPTDAKKLLEELATKDLVTSAHAWAALAGLRGAGDPKGRDEALAKCKAMAGKQAATVCAGKKT